MRMSYTLWRMTAWLGSSYTRATCIMILLWSSISDSSFSTLASTISSTQEDLTRSSWRNFQTRTSANYLKAWASWRICWESMTNSKPSESKDLSRCTSMKSSRTMMAIQHTCSTLCPPLSRLWTQSLELLSTSELTKSISSSFMTGWPIIPIQRRTNTLTTLCRPSKSSTSFSSENSKTQQ